MRKSSLRERPFAILPGQYFDAETGLHQNWYRDYDPSIGRYLQSDPLGLEAGTNTYAYALQNPATWFDVTGLETRVEGPGVVDYVFGPLLDWLFKCRPLQRQYDAAWKKCEKSKECQPPPPKPDGSRDLEKWIVFAPTGDPNLPIRRCVQRDNPGLVSKMALECGMSVVPGVRSVLPKETKGAF